MTRTRKNGFTLVELLIAIGISGIITVLVYGSFARTFDTREFVLQSQERYHTVRVALERMAREISMAFVYDCREVDTPTGERRHKTLFKVEREGKVDRMVFTSFSHMRLFKDVNESDQNVLSYYGDPDRRGARGGRRGAGAVSGHRVAALRALGRRKGGVRGRVGLQPDRKAQPAASHGADHFNGHR
jgi:general secretion pathway protein J